MGNHTSLPPRSTNQVPRNTRRGFDSQNTAKEQEQQQQDDDDDDDDE